MFLQLAAGQQQKMDIHTEAVPQYAATEPAVMLRSTRKSVVPDQQHLRDVGARDKPTTARPLRSDRPNRNAGRAPVGALAPFVPGVDADDGLAEECFLLRLFTKAESQSSYFAGVELGWKIRCLAGARHCPSSGPPS